MGKRIFFFLYYYLFWVLLFMLMRCAFLVYQHIESFEYGLMQWFTMIYQGIGNDLAAAAVLALFPGIVLVFTTHTRGGKLSSILINTYTGVLLPIILLLLIIDMALYHEQNLRMHQSVLQQVGLLPDIFEGSESLFWVKNLLFFLIVCVVFIAYYFESVGALMAYFKKANLLATILLVVVVGALYIPIVYVPSWSAAMTEATAQEGILYEVTLNPFWQLVRSYIGG